MAGETFKEEYLLLLMKQYFNQPNARAEMELKICEYEKLFCIIDQFPEVFDIHDATGDRLDKIGAIVGVGRTVCDVVENIAFGFAGNSNALDDEAYRQVIKARIAVNNGSAFITSCDRISLQDVIQTAFGGRAWVVDNYDMSLNLYISPAFEEEYLRLINKLGLLPRPQGVGYNQIAQAIEGQTFGFADNPQAVGFGCKFNGTDGFFAMKVI